MDIKISVIVCLALVTFCQCEDYPKFEEKNDPGKEEIALQRMITDSTGSLYIGSVNRLYRLSSELEIEQEVVTGPKDDNSKPACIPPDFNDNDCDELFPTNNVNKILVLDTRRDWVITCGSVFKGTCQTRNKQTLDIEKEFFTRQVASASPSASTVGLIAPGPGPVPGPGSDVLYVARSDVSATRTRWEALTSRVLPVRDANDDEAFDILSSDVLQNTAVIRGDDDYLNNHPDFNIEYVYGFSSKGFTYYVAVQPVGDSGPFVTRIVQICQICPLYQETYIDLPLVCRSNSGTEYNLAQSAYATQAGTDLSQDLGLNNQDDKTVVIVSFAKSDGTSSTPSDESAVCIYPVKTIREKYLEWIRDCSNNADKQPGCDWSAQQIGIDCGTVSLDDIIGEDMCDCRPFGKMTCGSLDIVKTAAFTVTGSRVTAVAATTHLSHTVMFTGDSSGQLKKLKVTSGTSATEYEAIAVVRDNPEIVQNGLVFDNQKNFIYVMSKRQITKVPVENCEQYTNCEDCTAIKGVGDPYCGWCSLENKCSRKAECAGSNDDNSNRWIGNLGACPSMVVEPASVERGQLETLTLTVTSLPETSGGFSCVFANLGNTDAVKKEQNGNELTCSTPSPTNVPAPGDRGFVRVKLSLLADETDVNFVSVDFDFYECESFKTCMACTNNSYGCDWCIFENKCSKDTTTCRNDGVVQGNANAEGSSDSCPQITAGDEILIPVDVDQEYQVKGKNFPTATSGQSGYQCVLIIEGVEVVVDGQRVDEQTVRCQSSKYVYAQEVSNKLVPLKLRWNSGFDVDNPDNVQVNLYKCDVGRSNCGVCHQADLKYNCGWCESGDEEQKCTVVSKCSQVTHWLTRDKICPDPTITEMKPMAGPIEGGTTLTIRGYNLGKNASNVKEVMVVGFPCIPVSSGYKIAEQVQCVTSPSGSENSGKVQITIGDTGDQVTYTGTSTEDFSYVVSKIDGLTPEKGPQSGGTIVTISGENLNAGSVITATVAGYPCHITESSFDAITCVTSASDSSFPSGGVTVTFDGVAKTNTGAIYRYMADPVIQQLSRYEAFVSGGSKIEVTGGNLDIVHTRIMRVYIKGRYYDAECTLKSSTLMECYTPDVSSSGIQPTVDEPYECDFGFIMDSVANTTHLRDSLEPFFYYPDPKYINFEDGVKVYAGAGKEPLVIAGENLNLASNEVDVIVKIGDEFCQVTSLAWNQLTCSPPERPKGDSEEKGLEVTIYHGNVNVSIGVLKYASSGPALTTPAIAGIAAGAALCVLVIIVILVICKRKSKERSKHVKKLQIQLDMLEVRVAKECKEAFAELQTEMTDMTTDEEGVGNPFLDYRTYAMRVLFPGQEDHPVLRELEVKGMKRSTVEKGLREFGKLINNKTFLMTFIRTLESQKNFSMRDRVNVASLIMVALQGRMEYATEILKALLAELIDKSLEGKSHPKLLLRRTESIAEKMLTNWLTFLLYSFLREAAGTPLFMLYRALKQQIEKGPVDVITHEARYSLSEEKLIRQQIEYRTYTINVVNPDTPFEDKEEQYIQVKALDCDTINQVKEKFLDAIYKNAPYSTRPRVEQVDLEWRQGVSGRLSLADEDVTAKVEGEWKRVNTLEHYKVLDGAVMALVPKQGYNMSPGISSLRTGGTLTNMSLTSSPGHRSNSSMLINSEADSGHRLWHLVKQHDTDLQKEGDRTSKMVSEIYLTRLLTTKGTLQKFVDDLFETIFSTTHRSSALPLAIKYLFDFLDDQAREHGITDPDVVHTWKSNSLPLRFWVNLIKNPDFVFDVYKSQTVDACLSVVAQTFMDSCSTSEHKLGKDSPSSKLLYAKDIPNYRDWVYRFYNDIKCMPAISDQDMNSALVEESRLHQHEFNTVAALNELYFYYSQKYNTELTEALEDDVAAKRSRLAQKWEQIDDIMSGQSTA